MAIETLDDIVEELMDGLAVYGACGEKCSDDRHVCRCVKASELAIRIRSAVEVERALEGMRFIQS